MKWILLLTFFLIGCNTQNKLKLDTIKDTNSISNRNVKYYTLEKYLKTHQHTLNNTDNTTLGKVERKHLKFLAKKQMHKNDFFHKKVFYLKTPLTNINTLDKHPDFRYIYPNSTELHIIYYKNKAIVNYFYQSPCYPGSKDTSWIGGNDLVIINSKKILTKYTLGGYSAYGCPVAPIVDLESRVKL